MRGWSGEACGTLRVVSYSAGQVPNSEEILGGTSRQLAATRKQSIVNFCGLGITSDGFTIL